MQDLNIDANRETLLRSDAEQSAIDSLIELLRTGDEAQRCYSAQALNRARIQEATQALNDCLYHEDPDVVIDCANTLETLGSGDIPSLEDVARHHPDGDARIAGLKALAPHINTPSVEALFHEFALGRQDNNDWGLDSDWDDWWDLQLCAVNSLSEHIKESHFTLFLDILEQDPEPELAAKIYQGIAKININWVIEQLEKSAPMTTRKLVKALTCSDQQSAKAFLYKQLRSQDAEIQKIAINALCERNATEYFWDIVKCMRDSNASVQRCAILGIQTLNGMDNIDGSRLISYIKTAQADAQPELLKLIRGLNIQLTDIDLEWIISLADQTNPSLLNEILNVIQHDHSAIPELTDEQQATLVQAVLNVIEDNKIELHQKTRLTRQLIKLPNHHLTSLPVLQRILTKQDSQNLKDKQAEQPFYDSSLREACLYVIAKTPVDSFQHLIKMTLLGAMAYPNTIDVVVTSSENEMDSTALPVQHQPDNEQADKADEDDLTALLNTYGEQFQEPESIVNAPTSTLGSIQQANIEATLAPVSQDDDTQQKITDMVEQLDDELLGYADIVKDNFESAENLDLNRKKIARRPKTSNRVLSIRALGQSKNPQSAELLTEAILGAESNELREIFQALTLLKKAEPRNPLANNGLGAAGNVMHHGDSLSKQAAAHFLAVMPSNKALPLLFIGAIDENEHVRLCSLNAIEVHLPKVKKVDQPALLQILRRGLSDPAGGVRKKSMQLLGAWLDAKFDDTKLNEEKDDDAELATELETLIDLAIDDEECNSIAEKVLATHKIATLNVLGLQLSSLKDHRHPNAVKLMGALLS